MLKKLLLSIFVISIFCSVSLGQTYLLYGLTTAGGTNNVGTLFSYNLTNNSENVLLSFNNAGNGAQPYDNVVVDPNDGFLYAVTSAGGSHNSGVLFSYDPLTNVDSVRLTFDTTNGKGPEYGSLTFYNNMLYGMTLYGGTYNFGLLYSLDPFTNKDSTYCIFDTNSKAYYPAGMHLTPYSNGLLYGMTYAGGKYNRGTIMSFDPVTGKDSVVFNLDTLYGTYPIEGTLTLNPANNWLYTTTYKGGTSNIGAIICFNPLTGKDSLLISFNGPNGSEPYGSLMYDTVNSLFYGMTSAGGSKGGGVMFSFNPATGKDSTIFNFTGTNGAVPLGDLTLGTNNILYGMTLYGGTSNMGVIFSYDPTTGKDTAILNFNGANGASPYGSLTLAKAPVITSLTNQESMNNLLVYPNPMVSSATLAFNEAGKHFIELDDITGREISSVESTGKQYLMHRNGLTSGVYLIKVFNTEHTLVSVSRIVVQ